ncbi:hypothetical protein ACFYT4_28840 [Streptomyces sp. NPDC004609]|uniref:hypothetical protein n=1 Tax=Streptomyces sp. NPDC004609 TaxID=3364704 RepID=UPI00367A7B0D
MGMPRIPGVLARAAVALLAGVTLVLAGPGPAHATATLNIPAPQPGGISATVKLFGAKVPQPYNPDPTAYTGDRKCRLLYHDYEPTAGCGGFKVEVTFHNVRNQLGYQPSGPVSPELPITDGQYKFSASADTARTFRCLRPGGGFDPRHNLVVRTTQQPLSNNYYFADVDWTISELQTYPDRDAGPPFYVNFAPVEVNCPQGTTAHQYGLKVSNIKITAHTPYVFGSTVWAHPGPYYA